MVDERKRGWMEIEKGLLGGLKGALRTYRYLGTGRSRAGRSRAGRHVQRLRGGGPAKGELGLGTWGTRLGRAGDGLGDRVRWPLAVRRAASECVGVARPGRPSLLCTPRIAQSAVVFCSGCGMGSHLESHVQAEVSEWSQRSSFWSLTLLARPELTLNFAWHAQPQIVQLLERYLTEQGVEGREGGTRGGKVAPAPAPAPAPLEQLPLRTALLVLRQRSRLPQVQARRCGTAQYSTAWTDAVSVTRGQALVRYLPIGGIQRQPKWM